MLGRVLSIDYGLALASESLSAMLAGILQDSFSLTAMQVSAVFATIGFFSFGLWLRYRIQVNSSTKVQIEWEESHVSLFSLGDEGDVESLESKQKLSNVK